MATHRGAVGHHAAAISCVFAALRETSDPFRGSQDYSLHFPLILFILCPLTDAHFIVSFIAWNSCATKAKPSRL